MDLTSTDALASRIDRLEHENLWLKRIGALAIIGFLALVALGTDVIRKPRAIVAESFILNDEEGQPRAALGFGPDGPSLRFLDEKGRDQLALRAGNDGSSAVQLYQKGSTRASFTNYVGVGSSLILHHGLPRGEASMYMADDGASGISFNRERRGMAMNVDSDGTSKLKFTDLAGEEHTGMIFSPDGELTTLPGKSSAASSDAQGISQAKPMPDPTRDHAGTVEEIPSDSPDTALFHGAFGKRAFGSP